jgi:hypothetical protein
LDPSYLLKRAHTATADVGRAGAGVTSYFLPLPRDGAAIATCTALETACCMHAFADAEMEKGQTEWRIMVQIGCRCAGAPWASERDRQGKVLAVRALGGAAAALTPLGRGVSVTSGSLGPFA